MRDARRSAALTTEQVAARAGVAPVVVELVESGRHRPSAPLLYSIAGALGVTAASIADPNALVEEEKRERRLVFPDEIR